MTLGAIINWILTQMAVPGTAVGVIIGLFLCLGGQKRGWFLSGAHAASLAALKKEHSEQKVALHESINTLKAENAALIAKLTAALDRVEALTAKLAPWEEMQKQLLEATLAVKVRGSKDD